jgi:hypothetical protein
MKRSILMMALLAALSLSACERQPTVVTVPAAEPAPGPAGPQGDTGAQGQTGDTGPTGQTGDGTTVIVEPSPPPKSN